MRATATVGGYTDTISLEYLLHALNTTGGTETYQDRDSTDTSAFLGYVFGEVIFDEYELVETKAEPEEDGFWHPPYEWFIELPDFDPLPDPPCSPIVRYRTKPIRAPPLQEHIIESLYRIKHEPPSPYRLQCAQ